MEAKKKKKLCSNSSVSEPETKEKGTHIVRAFNTGRSYKRQGQATFEALCWFFFCNGGKLINGSIS